MKIMKKYIIVFFLLSLSLKGAEEEEKLEFEEFSDQVISVKSMKICDMDGGLTFWVKMGNDKNKIIAHFFEIRNPSKSYKVGAVRMGKVMPATAAVIRYKGKNMAIAATHTNGGYGSCDFYGLVTSDKDKKITKLPIVLHPTTFQKPIFDQGVFLYGGKELFEISLGSEDASYAISPKAFEIFKSIVVNGKEIVFSNP
jgi:hypothetical protein